MYLGKKLLLMCRSSTIVLDIPRLRVVSSARENHPTRGDFHARSRFARPTIPEEKWGTTRSLGHSLRQLVGILSNHNGDVKKNNRSYNKNINFAHASRFFSTLLGRHCTTTA